MIVVWSSFHFLWATRGDLAIARNPQKEILGMNERPVGIAPQAFPDVINEMSLLVDQR
jgi:hypothetical protein